MVSSRPVKILVIAGPTASGKSSLALDWAEQLSGEIVNADSRQFYRELCIGTAKPTSQELARAPHHLIDCASLTEPWDVARFVKEATPILHEISVRRRVPIVVGGTGLYLRALLSGLDDIPKIDSSLRLDLQNQFQKSGLSSLYERLQNLDPVGAKRLKATDTQRILRALEVVLQTQKPLHEFWEKSPSTDFTSFSVAIAWPRAELYQRINQRVADMCQQGLRAEALALQKKFPDNPVLQKTIGYREWFDPALTDEQHVQAEIQKNTRHFAKRQLTWFGKDTSIMWVAPDRLKSAKEKAFQFLQNS